MNGPTPTGRFPWMLFVVLLTLDVSAMLLEKVASLRAEGSGWALAVGFLRQPWVWVICAIKLGQLATWSAILARVALSRAYPMTAMATPLAVVAGALAFGERPGAAIWVGSGLITSGVLLMAPSSADRTGQPARGAPSSPPRAGAE